MALYWLNMFQNSKVGGGIVGVMEGLFGICMPEWFVYGAFPIALVLGLHYAPFAYILIGGILLGFKGHADVGRVFAGFCLVVGRMYSLFYNMNGSSATICIIVMGCFIEPSAGIVAAVVAAAVTWFSRYISVGAVAAAVILAVTTAILTDNSLIVRLALYTALMVILRHIPSLIRIINGKEERLDFKEDLTYKLH